MVYDSVRDRVVLFGGLGAGGDLDDTWEWSGSTWIRRATSPAPQARHGHAMAFDAERGVTVLFGGIAGATHLGDTWLWDGTAWKQAAPTRTPGAREGHAMAWIHAFRRVVTTAGWNGSTLLADAWEWSGSDWNRIPGAFGPSARAGHLLVTSVDSAAAYHGGGWNGSYLADAYTVEPFGGWRGPALPLPGARALAAAATDPIRRHILLHGGIGGTPGILLDDLHEFDGSRWQRIDETARPRPRSGHQLAWLGRSGEYLLFGGRTGAQLDEETWLLRRPAAVAGVLEERFGDARQRDDAASSTNTWGPFGASPGILGGDGLHGDFAPSAREVTLNTDDHLFPAEVTLSGKDERVTNGEFRFASVHIPAGVVVRVAGRNPLRMYVRGQVRIEGALVLDAAGMPEHDSRLVTGQPGGLGGAGGGQGGKGGDRADGLGVQPRFHGGKGADVQLPAGHAYQQRAAGTGGSGSLLFPLSGLDASVTYGFADFFSVQTGAGGGGGGSLSAGQGGMALRTYQNRTQDLGPPAPGGIRFDPYPQPPNKTSLEHFLIGGSGGGGGGSHPYFSVKGTRVDWRSGAGGAGGGGVLAARIGSDLLATAFSSIAARGGNAFESLSSVSIPTPGGGGAGGTILLQVAGEPSMQGVLDARGGAGGSHVVAAYNLETRGGNGGDGLPRLELPRGGAVSKIGQTYPPATSQNVVALLDSDKVTGVRSKWYAVPNNRAPRFLRYELQAQVWTSAVTFSDDARIGRLAGPGEAVRFYVQGARLDPKTGEPLPGTSTRWTPYVGPFAAGHVGEGAPNAIRFTLLFDGAINPAQVSRVTIRYEDGPGAFYVFGSSCGAAGHQPDLETEAGRVPRRGARFPLILEQLAPGRPAMLHLGASRSSWLGLVLPFDLTPAGAPGCALFASGDWAFPLFNATGRVVFGLDVPDDPGLRGATFYGQGPLWDPLANPAGFAVSNGIGAVIE